MCVMPWVQQMDVKNVVVVVVDNDHSTSSQRLIHSIEASRYFIFKGQKPTYQSALADIERGKADVVLVIPQDFGKNIAKGEAPQVLIAANAVNGTKGSMGSAYLSQIVSRSVPYATVLQQPSVLTLYNKHQNYKLYMIPALLAIVMMLMTGFLPTLNIVGEKETGTIEQINVTPVSKWAFILSKLIPYWLIALFVITVCLLLAWQGWGVWAYMVQGCTSAVLTVLLFWCICPWRPRFRFSGQSFRELAPMGCRLAATGLLDTAYIHARAFFIGKVYSPAALAGYKNGAQLAAMCPTVLCYMLDQITFPILSTLQSSPQKLVGVYRRYMRLFTLPIAWLCLFTAAFAAPLVRV